MMAKKQDPNIIEAVFKDQLGKPKETILFRKISKLGQGAFATCWKCENTSTKTHVAIKIIQKVTLNDTRHKAQLMTELKIHRGIKHQNIC